MNLFPHVIFGIHPRLARTIPRSLTITIGAGIGLFLSTLSYICVVLYKFIQYGVIVSHSHMFEKKIITMDKVLDYKTMKLGHLHYNTARLRLKKVNLIGP